MVLNFETLEDTKTNDEPYIYLLPSFTMIADTITSFRPDLAQDMNKARKEAENLPPERMRRRWQKEIRCRPTNGRRSLSRLSRYTGLSKEIIDEADLRIDVRKFTHYLLIDQKVRVGRLDARFTGPRSERVAGHAVLRSHGICDRPAVHLCF